MKRIVLAKKKVKRERCSARKEPSSFFKKLAKLKF